jgi:MFS superfamily sulfate permease-like transporter
MLVAIGIILISKQIPLLIGYDKPDFWENVLFNTLTLRHGFEQIRGLYDQISEGAIVIALSSLLFLALWKKYAAGKITFVPTSMITVLVGSILAFLFQKFVPDLGLRQSQFVSIPDDILSRLELSDLNLLFSNSKIWEYAVLICFVATLETLLSIEAIDEIDPQNRITPQNTELIAQGIGNFTSGIVGGLPITSVIVRSSANAEAGAKTKMASFFHGVWLLLTLSFAVSLVRYIPYCVLAVILIRTGYNLVNPKMVATIYKQGREQFFPFIITVIAILLTDLLIGVLIGIAYAVYFLIKHTYRAGYTLEERTEGHTRRFVIDLALNVSFLNKKRFRTLLESIPEYSIVEINAARSLYIDHDILEIFHDFKINARSRHIQLLMKGIPDVVTIGLH